MAITNFLVTGMFRSGTTLLARMLHANRHIICASDPFAPVFKAYRNYFGRRLRSDFDVDSPLHDYYFDGFQNHLYRAIQERNFDVDLAPGSIDGLVSKIKQHSAGYSPLIHDHLQQMKGGNFSEIMRAGLRIIETAYPKEGRQAIGFKEVWVGEFTPHFLGIAPEAKVLHIVRDPRAVVGSNFASGARYPLLFLVRQWRKLATLAWLSANSAANVKVIKFEELVSSPLETAKAICVFLGVDFDEDMMDMRGLKDGANQPWRQNSSYKDFGAEGTSPPDGLNVKSVERWRSALSGEVIRLTEKLCFFEMKLFGYDFLGDISPRYGLDDGLLYSDEKELLSDWIKPYSSFDYVREMMAENARYALMRDGARLGEEIEGLFALHQDAYAKLVSL